MDLRLPLQQHHFLLVAPSVRIGSAHSKTPMIYPVTITKPL